MPETHDVPGTSRYVTTVRYPPSDDLPLTEPGVETRETEEPFRIGVGRALRVPFTRHAVVLGAWQDEGGDEVERLTAALRGGHVASSSDEIGEW